MSESQLLYDAYNRFVDDLYMALAAWAVLAVIAVLVVAFLPLWQRRHQPRHRRPAWWRRRPPRHAELDPGDPPVRLRDLVRW